MQTYYAELVGMLPYAVSHLLFCLLLSVGPHAMRSAATAVDRLCSTSPQAGQPPHTAVVRQCEGFGAAHQDSCGACVLHEGSLPVVAVTGDRLLCAGASCLSCSYTPRTPPTLNRCNSQQQEPPPSGAGLTSLQTPPHQPPHFQYPCWWMYPGGRPPPPHHPPCPPPPPPVPP